MYEDYMQNLLGIPIRQYPNTYEEQSINPYGNFYEANYRGQYWQNNMSGEELENCYPEIYNIVYPMVRKTCMSNTVPITQTVIDNMVNEIVSNIEANDIIELNINIGNEVNQNRSDNQQKDKNSQGIQNRTCENERCDRQIRRNPFLNDLIRILILRELLGRPGNRPPFPPNRPPRPPMPGRPPMPRYDGIENEYYYNPNVNNKFLRF